MPKKFIISENQLNQIFLYEYHHSASDGMWQIAKKIVQEMEYYPQSTGYFLDRREILNLSPEYANLPLKHIKIVFTENLPDNIYGQLENLKYNEYNKIEINVNAYRKRGASKTTYTVHHELTHYIQTLKKDITHKFYKGETVQIKNANIIQNVFLKLEIDARISAFSRYLDDHRGEFKKLTDIPDDAQDILQLNRMKEGIEYIQKEKDTYAGTVFSTTTILFSIMFPNSKTQVRSNNFESVKQKILSVLTKKYDYTVQKANKILYDHMQ